MFDFTTNYLRKDGNPWFPVMGEMHYSRYHRDLWEESLRKMKAGGLSIVSSYVIWIHHEEENGVFDFSGDRDLRTFLRLCQKVGLYVFLRLGPWVHGEVRNGGLPDWLQKQESTICLRSDDPRYLAYVRRYWSAVAEQANGMMFADGGPVIGVQIENEYGHVGGFQGEKGEAHMHTLDTLANSLGFTAPLRTATGWGGAATGGLLPVMGGYCEAPWAQTAEELAPNTNYVFSTIRNDALIACDHNVSEYVSFDEKRFPYLTAELGGGLQVTQHRRPVATGQDIGAMSVTKMGSGAALLGYYMYHGGSNPEGKLSTLQESTATGYANDLPEINYDFNAPIRQFGTISDAYREIRLLATFLQDFGADFVTLAVDIDPDHVKPSDFSTLRLAYRHDESHGYVFFNNYQRRHAMAAHPGTRLSGRCGGAAIEFPPVDILPGQYGFFPYHLPVAGCLLETALAIPLCLLRTASGEVPVFYGDWAPDFHWQGAAPSTILHLSRAEALRAAKVQLAQEHLVLADDFVWVEDGRLVVTGGPDTEIVVYPALQTPPAGFVDAGQRGEFRIYRRRKADAPATLLLSTPEQAGDTVVYRLAIHYPAPRDRAAGRDTLLDIRYAGSTMDIYAGGKKLNDYFYTGQTALFSLGYWNWPTELTLVVHPLCPADRQKIYLESWPVFENGTACRIDGVSVREEHRTV